MTNYSKTPVHMTCCDTRYATIAESVGHACPTDKVLAFFGVVEHWNGDVVRVQSKIARKTPVVLHFRNVQDKTGFMYAMATAWPEVQITNHQGTANLVAVVPDPTCVDPSISHEHCPIHGCVEYVCCVPK